MGGLAKGLQVILAFDREHPSMTLSQVAARAGLAPAVARRCLLTLEQLGYVVRAGRLHALSVRVLALGAAYRESVNVDGLTRDYLEDLARATQDSAALCVLDGDEVVYVARASVRTVMRLEAHVGTRYPAYCTSVGRVLLAGLPAAAQERYFRQLKPRALTDRTVTDLPTLRRLVAQCGKQGWSAVEDELDYGVAAVAVPVFDSSGRVVAALNSSGHSRRSSARQLARERLPLLRKTSARITQELAQGAGLSLGSVS
jgi:IclR family pca regulon transcriptional regulator